MRSTNKIKILSVFLLSVCFLFSVRIVVAAEPILLGATIGLTGKYQSMAEMQQRGFRLWEKHINKAGGILGRPVKILIYDDLSDREKAKELYEKLITEDKVDFLFGPYSSSITLAIMPVVEKYDIPLLATAATADKIWQQGYRNVFGLYLAASRYTIGMLELSALEGFRKVAIVSADDTFSTTVASGADNWANKFGMQVVNYEVFKKGTRDLSPIAEKLAKSSAEVVIVCGHFNESVDMKKALAEVGYEPGVYFATVGPALTRYLDKLGHDLADSTFTSVQWSADVNYRPGSKAAFYEPFVNAYKVEPSYHAAIAFAGGDVLATAIERVATMDKARVREMLYSMDILTVVGRYGVDKTGMQVKHFPVLMQWQDGVQKVVWPEDLANTTPRFPDKSHR